jgi:hypothetical protein
MINECDSYNYNKSKMYSLSGRLNTIAFNTLICLAALASLNFLSSYPWGGKHLR